ncbi:MAG: VWA domain-containing protein [Fusobacterium sp.]|nr:VWA domain-containing protein [Fusobacterium sp.]
MNISENLIEKIKEETKMTMEEFITLRDKELNDYIEREKYKYIINKEAELDKEFPFRKELKKFENFFKQDKFEKKEIEESIDEIENLNLKLKKPFNKKWWLAKERKLDRKNEEEIIIFKGSIKQEWEKNLTLLIENWELEQIKKIRAELIKKYREKLKNIKRIREVIDDLDLGTGILWDLSKRNIIDSDVKTLMKWIDILKDNEDIRKLCELLGKMRVYNKVLKREKYLSDSQEIIKIPKIDSSEEIFGIKLGKNIEALLPSELSVLAYPELETLFDLKYVGSKLMMYDFQGYEEEEKKIKEEVSIDKEVDGRGPMIICVDTSGSMAGSPERIAKAISFAIVSRAISVERACMLINFSTEIEVVEFDKISGFAEILEFLKKSFHGGTDIFPALSHTLDMLEKEEYEKSDILILSDFVLDDIDKNIEYRINQAKLLDNKFYSVAIGDLFMDKRLRELFTRQWVYNPDSSNADLLNEITSIDF